MNVKDNLLLTKSKAFALRIIKLYKHLCSEKQEYIMSKQVMRSGTSVGANMREAKYAQSHNDFIAKAQIALKEAGETAYWLELLFESEYMSEQEYTSIYADCEELIRLLVASLKTAKAK